MRAHLEECCGYVRSGCDCGYPEVVTRASFLELQNRLVQIIKAANARNAPLEPERGSIADRIRQGAALMHSNSAAATTPPIRLSPITRPARGRHVALAEVDAFPLAPKTKNGVER